MRDDNTKERQLVGDELEDEEVPASNQFSRSPGDLNIPNKVIWAIVISIFIGLLAVIGNAAARDHAQIWTNAQSIIALQEKQRGLDNASIDIATTKQDVSYIKDQLKEVKEQNRQLLDMLRGQGVRK